MVFFATMIVGLLFVFLFVYGYFYTTSQSDFVSTAHAQPASEEEIGGWMWNGIDDNNDSIVDGGVGWISLNCSNRNVCDTSNYAVRVDSDGVLSGYAWAGDYGWLSFEEDTVSIEGSSLTGRARFLTGDNDNDGWDGWVEFTDVTVSGSGDISGYAWNGDDSSGNGNTDNGLGWFEFVDASFSDSGGSSDPFGVDLTADPETSTGQFTPDLIAQVYTDYSGPYRYSFKCDSAGPGEDITSWDTHVNDSGSDEETYTGCTYGSDGLSGAYTAWLRVTNDESQTEYASVNVSICVPGDPVCNLDGCYAASDLDGDGTIDLANERIDEDDEVVLGDVVKWVAEASSGPFSYNWSGDAPLGAPEYQGTAEEIDVVYETVGIKNGEAQIVGGGSSVCTAGFRVVVDPDFEEF